MTTASRADRAAAIWQATHRDYRTSGHSEAHPGVLLLLPDSGTCLVPLLTLDEAAFDRLERRTIGCAG